MCFQLFFKYFRIIFEKNNERIKKRKNGLPRNFKQILLEILFSIRNQFSSDGQSFDSMIEKVAVRGSGHTRCLLEHHLNCVLHTGQVVDGSAFVVIVVHLICWAHFRFQRAFELNRMRFANAYDRVEQVQVGQFAVWSFKFHFHFVHVQVFHFQVESRLNWTGASFQILCFYIWIVSFNKSNIGSRKNKANRVKCLHWDSMS